MGIIKEFRDFAMKGNVVDMAVGIVIGAAFGKIVSALVENVIMPPIGLLVDRVDFSELAFTLTEPGAEKSVTIKYGLFLNTVINFVIQAFAIFIVIKAMNRLRKPTEVVVPTTKDCPFCLSKIPIKATRCAHCTAELRA